VEVICPDFDLVFWLERQSSRLGTDDRDWTDDFDNGASEQQDGAGDEGDSQWCEAHIGDEAGHVGDARVMRIPK
jgi:hypothetical protein